MTPHSLSRLLCHLSSFLDRFDPIAHKDRKVKTMLERITYDPNILGGKPIIKGTRISVQFILELLGAGMSIAEILSEYPHLQREDILAALDYAAKTIANEEIIIPSELPEATAA
jgi:uncharacterized protein (DUF433 family)